MRLNALALFCAALALSGCSIPQALGPTVLQSTGEGARGRAQGARHSHRAAPREDRVPCGRLKAI